MRLKLEIYFEFYFLQLANDKCNCFSPLFPYITIKQTAIKMKKLFENLQIVIKKQKQSLRFLRLGDMGALVEIIFFSKFLR